jgi:hypothetical protein
MKMSKIQYRNFTLELELNAAILDTFLTGDPMAALFIGPLIIPKYAPGGFRYPKL